MYVDLDVLNFRLPMSRVKRGSKSKLEQSDRLHLEHLVHLMNKCMMFEEFCPLFFPTGRFQMMEKIWFTIQTFVKQQQQQKNLILHLLQHRFPKLGARPLGRAQ